LKAWVFKIQDVQCLKFSKGTNFAAKVTGCHEFDDNTVIQSTLQAGTLALQKFVIQLSSIEKQASLLEIRNA